MSVYNVHAGHCPYGKGAYGAVGILNESNEARLVKDEVIRLLRNEGHTVYDCTCEENTTQNGCLQKIVSKCNSHKVDLDISIHLNSGRNDYKGDSSTGGTEVFNYDDRTKNISDRICNNISSALGIRNRGTKYNKNLYVLANTNSLAILVECCFVDDADDVKVWDVKKCAKAIVEGVLNKKINNNSNKISEIQLYEPNSTNAQKWVLEKQSDGSYFIKSLSCGLYLDVQGANIKNGTIVRVYSKNETDAQKWFIYNKENSLDSPCNIKCYSNNNFLLDVKNGDKKNGAKIQIYENNGTSAQLWNFIWAGDNGYTYYIINAVSCKALDVVGGGV